MWVKGYGGRELVRIYRRVDELCRQLFEAAEISTDIIIAVDNSGSIVFCDDGARRKLGYSSEEVLGRHVTLIYGDLAEARRLMSAMRSADRDTAGKTDNFETVLIDKSGNRIPAAISASFIKDAEARY
jgi:PAS domain S-box-containing protein